MASLVDELAEVQQATNRLLAELTTLQLNAARLIGRAQAGVEDLTPAPTPPRKPERVPREPEPLHREPEPMGSNLTMK